jgi:hypothetical protein
MTDELLAQTNKPYPKTGHRKSYPGIDPAF